MSAFIKVQNVSLSVPIYLQRERRARGWSGMLLGAAFDPPKRELIQLLDGICFEAHEGDRIAILGRNGAGKSTLLRTLNGVYAPTVGSVRISGSCQALLNLSLGFSNEATVRENIFLRGTAMGLRASDLREQIDPILDFSGLHEKSNHRLRTLSSGQRVRLGFAISTCFQHDIILMDEWVGTGDSEFMAKATERMQGRVGGSKIVMLASHSIGLVRDICNKAIVLEQGQLVFAGGIVPGLEAYHELLAAHREHAEYIAQEAAADGDLSYGCVESLKIERGKAYLQGWCVNTAGVATTGLVVESGGVRFPVMEFERYPRPDVKQHLGLTDANCGFRARFDLPGIDAVGDLGLDLKVLGGNTAELARAPLRIAPSIKAMLQAETRSRTAAMQ
jgi:ABC-type polysaccharide/polyol phosphate transport system, ATPase component